MVDGTVVAAFITMKENEGTEDGTKPNQPKQRQRRKKTNKQDKKWTDYYYWLLTFPIKSRKFIHLKASDA